MTAVGQALRANNPEKNRRLQGLGGMTPRENRSDKLPVEDCSPSAKYFGFSHDAAPFRALS